MFDYFNNELENAPIGGGIDSIEDVQFFAGDGIPLSYFQSFTDGGNSCSPFLWVRLTSRFRTETFPVPHVGPAPCGMPRAVKIETGISRCAVNEAEPTRDELAREAEIELDDSNRVDLALCRGLNLAKKHGCVNMTAIETVIPFGPEGGIIAWLGLAYAQL